MKKRLFLLAGCVLVCATLLMGAATQTTGTNNPKARTLSVSNVTKVTDAFLLANLEMFLNMSFFTNSDYEKMSTAFSGHETNTDTKAAKNGK